MTKSQKKTLNHLLMLCIIFIMLLLVLVLAKRHHEASVSTDADTSAASSAAEEETAAITAISYSNGSTTLSFSRNTEGIWLWDGDSDFPLDTTVIDAMMDSLTPLAPVKVITEGDTLEAYGLDNDTTWLTAAYEDGTKLRLDFGDQAPDSTNYYALKDSDTATVYVLSSTIPSRMGTAIYDMMDLPDLPELAESDFSSVTVQGAAETVMIAFEETVKTGSGDAAGSSAAASSSAAAAQAETVVSWRCSGEDITDNERRQALVTALSGLRLDRCENFKPSDSAVAMWGLDAPAAVVKVTYGTDELLTLQIGGETLDGEGRYVRINDDTTIYSIDSGSLEPILTVAELGLDGAEPAAAPDAA